ncbi:hypothetical protein PLESTB_000402200 [Pleodorina starrii]|uniref:SET domain-containing protein n=1 Tax=Pleodorina starrii TaxID=330485 RepID=A0A9W6EZU0_9CHLO|nr:hypothetical protein PLESTB_000402200 [Pleodorina starrii]GLC75255.1 hypothetical protein PLESTF_001613900 [Pleodorina starrii]
MSVTSRLSHRSGSAHCPLRSEPAKAASRRAAAAVAAAAPWPPSPAYRRGPDRRLRAAAAAAAAAGVPAGAAAAAAAGSGGRDAAAAAEEARQDAALRLWIQNHGGFVHEAISITSATQCGARGLVASAAIDLDQLESSSLVVVPRALHLDNRAAVEAIAPLLGRADRQEAFAEQLGQLQQVACCLAVERAKGADSFWLPYLRTLPDTPPNPWLLTGSDLTEVLEAVAEAGRSEAAEAAAGEGASSWGASEAEAAAADSSVGWSAGAGGCRAGWAAAVEAARRRYGAMADEVLEVVGGDSSRLKLDREGLMWALGQVVSRSLGSGRSSGLLPYIDMANHHSAARPPMMMLDEQDRLVFAVTSIRGGQLAPLEKGQELFISYQAEDMSPLQAWLKWGFVPHTLP